MSKEEKKPPTLEERKAAAEALIGNDGVVIVKPDGSIETQDLNLRKKPKPRKTVAKLPRYMRASPELSYGYKVGEFNVGRRAERVYAWSREEYKRLRELSIYLHMMHVYKLTDEPEKARSSKQVDIDEVDEIEIHRATEKRVDTPPEPTWDDNKQIALEAGLYILSDQELRAAWLHIGEGLSEAETADHMGVDKDTVKKYIYRARKKWAELRNGAKSRLEGAKRQ